MAIKKVPRREENTMVGKSLSERMEESRLIRLQQKALADLNESLDEDAVDSSIEEVQINHEALRQSEEMGNENLLINDEVKVDHVEEEIEVTKGADETYQKQVTEAEVPGMAEDLSSKGSINRQTDIEKMVNAQSTKIRFPYCKSRTVSDAMKGVLTIVSAEKNSYRIMLAEKVIDYIGNLEEVQFIFAGQGIVVSGKPSTEAEPEGVFALKKQGKAYVIYSAPLVKEITTEYALDFSGTVSRTFSDATYGLYKGRKVVLIKLA